MPPPRVLISGASVAGPALAYWLVRAGCKVTLVERSPVLRTAGQGVDVRDDARDVIKRMGIFDTMRDRSSHEEGLQVIDHRNRPIARFAVDESGNGDGPTCDIEILRGELAGILFDITKDHVEYIFGDMVESLEQTGKEVNVSFASGTPKMAFDLVVAADGMGSRIRGMALGKCHVRSLNSYVTYFSIPRGETDSMDARVHWVKGGRNLSLRPDNVGRTRAFLSLTAYDGSDERLARLGKASKEGVSAQKAVVQGFFQDAGWESSRILKGMQESDDLYMQHIAQVRLERWSSGRVTAVGDACYAPSPFTGMGTSLAFLGAYVLAGEISRQPENVPAALEAYERVLRPHVERVQKLPPGIPWVVNPQSAAGVRVLEVVAWCLGFLAKSWVSTLFFKLMAFIPSRKEVFKLPEYEAFGSKESRSVP